MEQRRRPPRDKVDYQVNQKSGHIKTRPQYMNQPYSASARRQLEQNIIKKNNNKVLPKAKITHLDDYKKQLMNTAKKPTEKKAKKISFRRFKPVLIVGFIALLSFAAVYQNAQVQSWGLTVNDSRTELLTLQNKNEVLRQEKAELTKLDRIERIAKNDLKMRTPAHSILYEPKSEKSLKN